MQKVTITQIKENSSVIKNRKEKHFYKSYSLLVEESRLGYSDERIVQELAVIRFYSATGSRVHAVLWINDNMESRSGGGYADGYGYHKESAAAASAFAAAGIELEEPIDGRGDSAVVEALHALARAKFRDKSQVLQANA